MGKSPGDALILKAMLRSNELTGGINAMLPGKFVQRPDGSSGRDLYVPASAYIPEEDVAEFEQANIASDTRVVLLSDEEFRQEVGDLSDLPA